MNFTFAPHFALILKQDCREGTMIEGIASTADALFRFVYLGSMAIGLGTMVATDWSSIRRVGRPVTREYCDAIESAHSIIAPALIVAWISGLALLVLRTGLAAEAMSAKLYAKLFVVTTLTLTAIAVKTFVMPILLGLKGKTLMEADLGEKLVMAVCAALSMCGWGLALALGGFTVLKTMPGYVLFPMILFAYATALGTAIFGAFRLHARLGGMDEMDERLQRI